MLAYSGQEVHFLLHSDYEFIKEHGMQVDSCDGSFHLEQVNVYQYPKDMPKCDVVIVGLKTTNNHLLPELLPPLLHKHTVVVLIQNGIGVEADVQQMFPDVPLIGGLAFICSAKTEPGRVNHMEDTFRFKIDLGYADNIELWIEIPEELHQRISESVGTDKMARYDFGFHFCDYLKEHFPELDQQIYQKIEDWKQQHYGHQLPDHVLHLYGLVSPWFEEE